MRTSTHPWSGTSRRGRISAVLPSGALLAAAAAFVPAARAAPQASATRGLSDEQARRILPRADLSGLTDEQRAQFLEVAGDVFDYAGCRDTLAKCLGADVQDVHAPRMAELIKALLLEGGAPSRVIETVEHYYASFDPSKRQALKTGACAVLGDAKAPVALDELGEYQCPPCATANKP